MFGKVPVRGPLFIRHKDIMMVRNIQATAASQLMKTMRAAYGKAPHQKITVREFAEYLDVPIEEVLRRMGY